MGTEAGSTERRSFWPTVLSWTTVALSLATVGWLVTLIPAVSAGSTPSVAVPWVEGLGVELAFRLDGLSVLFGLLVAGVGAVVAAYARVYLAAHEHLGRFFGFFLAFEVAMLGLVFADDLITLFVFWELTTISSFLLIGFDHEDARARRNAVQAALVTGIGGLALLCGFLLLGDVAGTWRISELVTRGAALREGPLYPAILVLVLLGAFTKSAQFPFHFWLPNAMAAPTPVSAYLHSATMVKAGIYLLARLHPALAGSAAWTWTLTVVGAVTAVWASLVALRQTDLKLALAWTTLMALGTLTMFLGAEEPVAVAAAITFLIVHALYKSALFLVVGTLDHEAGTRDVTRLGGLGRRMPRTAFVAGAAALSMAGFPPFLGFVGKELKYEGALAVASEPTLVAAAAVTANALMVAVALVLALRPFWGGPTTAPRPAHDPPLAMWLGPAVLATLGLVLGLLPPLVGEALVQPAVTAVMGAGHEPVNLALWHGVTVPLLLSVVTVVSGLTVYRFHRPLRRALGGLVARLPLTGDRAWDAAVAGTIAGAGRLTRALQHGSLRGYLTTVFAVLFLGVGAALVAGGGLTGPAPGPPLTFEDVALLGLLLAGVALVVLARSRIAAVAGLGATGTGLALVFLSHGAPDVALTQLVVEVLFVVILAFVLPRLATAPAPATRRRARIRDGAVALLAGGVTTALLFAVSAVPASRHLSEFFAERSVPEAYGRNIVNVILVDFRALDTLGEIVVVAVAAIAGFALLAGRRPTPAPTPAATDVTRPEPASATLFLRTAARLIVPLVAAYSVYLLLRGHNEPGGGFVGGLVAAAAIVVHALANGAAATGRLLRVDPRALSAFGLLVALAASALGPLLGGAFLEGVWATPLGVPLGSPLLFDLGVYLVVVGAVTALVIGLAAAPPWARPHASDPEIPS